MGSSPLPSMEKALEILHFRGFYFYEVIKEVIKEYSHTFGWLFTKGEDCTYVQS